MSEREKIDFESKRNELVEAFFDARPKLARNKEQEWLVESGFRLAWEYLKRGRAK